MLCLGVNCGVPLIQRDLHGGFVESRGFGSCIADENIERAKLGANLLEDPANLLRMATVGLNQKSI